CEPVHGSAPDIFGQNIANPIAMIWSAALMVDFLGDSQGVYKQAHDDIIQAIEQCLSTGPRTPDLSGQASTTDVGKAIAASIEIVGCSSAGVSLWDAAFQKHALGGWKNNPQGLLLLEWVRHGLFDRCRLPDNFDQCRPRPPRQKRTRLGDHHHHGW